MMAWSGPNPSDERGFNDHLQMVAAAAATVAVKAAVASLPTTQNIVQAVMAATPSVDPAGLSAATPSVVSDAAADSGSSPQPANDDHVHNLAIPVTADSTALAAINALVLNAFGAGNVTVTDGVLTVTLPSAPAGGTPALTLGTANAAGSATTFVKTDATILAFDATAPSTQAFGDAAAVGSAAVAARRDHKHAMMDAPAGGMALVTSPISGHLLTTNGSGQALDSGNSLADVLTMPAVAVVATTNIDLTIASLPTVDGRLTGDGATVLFAGQTVPSQNGPYTVHTSAVPTRTYNMLAGKVAMPGIPTAFWVEAGATYGQTLWVLNNSAPATVGTDGLTFVQVMGGGGAGVVQIPLTVSNLSSASAPDWAITSLPWRVPAACAIQRVTVGGLLGEASYQDGSGKIGLTIWDATANTVVGTFTTGAVVSDGSSAYYGASRVWTPGTALTAGHDLLLALYATGSPTGTGRLWDLVNAAEKTLSDCRMAEHSTLSAVVELG